MSSLFRLMPEDDAPPVAVQRRPADPWLVAIGAVAGLLLAAGVITVVAGLAVVSRFGNTVLGQDQQFDAGVATAIVGGAAIVLGILVGTCWLVLGHVDATRRGADR